VATGSGVTVTAACAVRPSLVAVTVVAPGATAVTTPCEVTVATAAFPVLQVIARSGSGWASASSARACSVALRPTRTDTATGVIATLATSRAVTVMVLRALRPPALAAMRASPTARASPRRTTTPSRPARCCSTR
jgi:hypothetical protein